MVDEGKIKELENVLGQRLKQANEANKRVKDLERKSEQDDQEIRFLRDELEKERRKSNADENTIKKLEYLIAEKLKIIDGEKARNTSLEGEIRALK